MPNILTTFPNFMNSDSLFQKMVEYGAPWTQEVAESMDMAYFTMYSPLKTPSLFVRLNSTDGIGNSKVISKVLYDMFGKNWEHLWNAYISEYSPLDNYNVTESTSRNETDQRTIGKGGTFIREGEGSINETSEDNGSVKVDYGQIITTQGETDDYVYGFNSSEKAPTASQARNGTETHSGADTTTTKDNGTVGTTSKESRTDTSTEHTEDSDVIEENIERTRKGNVGQNSYQELLRQDFELWKWNFFWSVFEDCDSYLCLSIFDQCQQV